MDAWSRGQREYESLIGRPPGEALGELRASNPQLYRWLFPVNRERRNVASKPKRL
jgi:hypothetical protein